MDSEVATVTDNDCLSADMNRPSNKKPICNRPAMQIYRPPGLRSGAAPPQTADSPRENLSNGREIKREKETQRIPSETAGTKPFMQMEMMNIKEKEETKREENNNVHRNSPPSINNQRLNRTESNLSSESALSQKSTASGGASLGSTGNGENIGERKKKGPTPPKITPKEKARKQMSSKDMKDAAIALRALHLNNNTAEMEQLIASDFSCEQSAESVGSALAQHAIEGGSGCAKQVTKTCGLMRDSIALPGLAKGLLNSISQYYDCRDRLRQEHFRMWIAFLNFVSDLYSNIGCNPSDELVNVVFQMFDYLLRPPVLDALKIEELESLISALLSIGYDLERDCPDQLSGLKDLIRNAFIDVTEPWARKMILLLLELGASGWKLPPEANEYYFQQGNH